MKKALEQFLLKRWYSEKPIALLQPLAWLFNKIATSKRHAYQTGRKLAYQSPVPVVVVGNITVGGTGKTPVVIFLVNELKQKGLKPAVISRGYGTDIESSQLVNDELDFRIVGDEPKLIQVRTGVPVAVGRNRQASIKLIMQKHP